MKYSRILFVRHGHTTNNGAQERFRSWSEIPLSEQGWKESIAAGKKIEELAVNPKLIYSSDLPRAVETARIIRDNNFPGLPIHTLRSLRDWNLGDYINKRVDLFGPEISALQVMENEQIPNGESYRAYRDRYDRAVKKIVARQLLDSREGDFIVVTHSRNLLTLPNVLDKKAEIPISGRPLPGEILKMGLYQPAEGSALGFLGEHYSHNIGTPFYYEFELL